jgi:1-deoxy-D-xylulose-5-phosphate synthase
MSDGTGLVRFKNEYPERFFDVGIAEAHAVTFGAGLAADGMRPCVAVYSTFLQRAYDSIIHDISLQKLPVTLCIDRSGLNSKDGPTHHGIFDVAFLSQAPDMQIYVPITKEGIARALRCAVNSGLPAAVRYANYPENERVISEFYKNGIPLEPAVLKNYEDDETLDAVIITYGKIIGEALLASDRLAKENIRVGIILLEYLKPYDKLAREVEKLMTAGIKAAVFLEEEIRNGGAGMLLSDKMLANGALDGVEYAVMATDDDFVWQKSGKSIYESAGVSASDIVDNIRSLAECGSLKM